MLLHRWEAATPLEHWSGTAVDWMTSDLNPADGPRCQDGERGQEFGRRFGRRFVAASVSPWSLGSDVLHVGSHARRRATTTRATKPAGRTLYHDSTQRRVGNSGRWWKTDCWDCTLSADLRLRTRAWRGRRGVGRRKPGEPVAHGTGITAVGAGGGWWERSKLELRAVERSRVGCKARAEAEAKAEGEAEGRMGGATTTTKQPRLSRPVQSFCLMANQH